MMEHLIGMVLRTRVTVGSGGAVQNVQIINGGSSYSNGETLDLDTFSGAEITITDAGISTFIGNSIQITGIGSTATNFYRVVGTPAKDRVSFAITNLEIQIHPKISM